MKRNRSPQARHNLAGSSSRDGRGISTTGLLLVGTAVATGIAIHTLLRRTHATQQTKQTEQRRDKVLKDTFPASDPPASQYFDIPVNRR